MLPSADWQCAQTERNIVKASERPHRRPRRVLTLPADIDSHMFTKFTNIYFKNHQWGLKKEAIKSPFLAKSNEQDSVEAVALFKLVRKTVRVPLNCLFHRSWWGAWHSGLHGSSFKAMRSFQILRFMYDPSLTGKKERLVGDYLVQRGLARPSLRDEIYCQLATQTYNNPDGASRNRCWLLMSNCLSCFPPSRTLYKYLLKYVSDHGESSTR